jgi:SAM-dependent methyltransferase
MNKNLTYSTSEISKYFMAHRRCWDEFYPSEQTIFEKANAEEEFGHLLDVGCATGGLGCVLLDRFTLASYTGVDINSASVELANSNKPKTDVHYECLAGDILHMPSLHGRRFNTVVSLSCVDWNIESSKMIKTCWDFVKPGGQFIVSVRLTEKTGVDDIQKSFQWIDYTGEAGIKEKANYVVYNVYEWLKICRSLSPALSKLTCCGNWGKPSPTAETGFDRLVFTVFSITKNNGVDDKRFHCDLPLDLFTCQSR